MQTLQFFVLSQLLLAECEAGDIMKSNSRIALQHPQVLSCCLFQLMDVLRCIFVFNGFDCEMDSVVGHVGLVESICFVNVPLSDRFSNCQTRLIEPASCNILHRIASASQKHQRHAITHHFLNTSPMAFNTQIEPA